MEPSTKRVDLEGTIIISAERAIRDGISERSLVAVARWNERKADECSDAARGKVSRDEYYDLRRDYDRHLRNANRLRAVVVKMEEVETPMQMAA